MISFTRHVPSTHRFLVPDKHGVPSSAYSLNFCILLLLEVDAQYISHGRTWILLHQGFNFMKKIILTRIEYIIVKQIAFRFIKFFTLCFLMTEFATRLRRTILNISDISGKMFLLKLFIQPQYCKFQFFYYYQHNIVHYHFS